MALKNEILKRRFGYFSTSSTFVLIKMRNRETSEESYVVCTNTSWYMFLRRRLGLVKDADEYVGYMTEHYDDVFDLDSETFERYRSPLGDDRFDAFADLGWEYVRDNFLAKVRGYYDLKNRDDENDPAFLRMLLLQNVVVRKDCYSGTVYVQE